MMDWIKKNPAKFALAIISLLAITATVFLWMKVSDFNSAFDNSRGGSVSNAPVEKLDTTPLDEAGKALDATLKWEVKPDEDSRLFVSKRYVILDGKLQRDKGKMFHPPVPNAWLERYKFSVLTANILDQDPDGDGFTNLEEFMGLDARSHLDMEGQPVLGPDGQPLPDDSTDPTDPKSHPPYHTKLELARIHNVPFRLRVMSIDVPAKVNKPSDVTVQINTIDVKNKTMFVPVGEDIPGTKYKIDSYEKKEAPGADGTTNDASEVTVINKETGAKVVLPRRSPC